jgi:hypothetical protein
MTCVAMKLDERQLQLLPMHLPKTLVSHNRIGQCTRMGKLTAVAHRLIFRTSCFSISTVYHIPGSIAYLFFLYLSPNSLRYLLSFFFAQGIIWPTETTRNSKTL